MSCVLGTQITPFFLTFVMSSDLCPRNTDIVSERIGHALTPDGSLPPVSGVNTCMPLVSLDEAIGSSGIDGVPSIASLPGMSDIDDNVFSAMAKAEELIADDGPDKHGLTPDHIGALNLYSQDILYDALNTALRSADRDSVKPFFSYLRLLLDALHLLPEYHPRGGEASIFRGVNKDLTAVYPDGKRSSSGPSRAARRIRAGRCWGIQSSAARAGRGRCLTSRPSLRATWHATRPTRQRKVLLPPGLQLTVNKNSPSLQNRRRSVVEKKDNSN